MTSDICAACADTIVYVGYLDQWQSATALQSAAVCPATEGVHEPSYSVG